MRVDVIVRPDLVIDWTKVGTFKIDPAQTIINADIAPALGSATAWTAVVDIDLAKLPDDFRLQRVIFKAVVRAFRGVPAVRGPT